jgi:hypothetical protein
LIRFSGPTGKERNGETGPRRGFPGYSTIFQTGFLIPLVHRDSFVPLERDLFFVFKIGKGIGFKAEFHPPVSSSFLDKFLLPGLTPSEEKGRIQTTFGN